MAEQSEDRVGVYLDFDNIVISRYNQLHGPNQFAKDKARHHTSGHAKADPAVTARIQLAMIDIGAVLDYASSFGAIVISRAYADWSAAVNARYQRQLTDRAVDLIQLFPTVASLKNGADIRLAIDVMEDSFRLADLSHIVIVAGDSDYIPLAQRCKRLGRYVIGIGVSGATSTSLAAACHEFADYDSLPGIVSAAQLTAPVLESTDAPAAAPSAAVVTTPTVQSLETQAASPAARKAATALLVRAMDLLAKNDQDWQHASTLKQQMKRMDPSFQERTLGFRQFSDFLRSRHTVVELDKKTPSSPILLRLRP
ncbi:NYN domain-containing protein [Cryobacterium adonitolivorans]|uniref:NYN domain-containing protein n=1 Tax=Cryobacterium adonitolivorans TaxID=1259189 RepID=A0A4R8W6D1_9MICO|nr:NYN domain-containing protein [Cryobacterium adonitolivorans]TFC01639.1 NYN domain-containing protein [Cryobacterium adonitolivorans]